MNLEKYKKEIPLKELIDFCDKYNSINFGKAKICELKNKFIVELYNAGFSSIAFFLFVMDKEIEFKK